MPADAVISGQQRPTIMAGVLLAAIRGYQVLFSPFYAGSCRFVPSCSQYASEAIHRFGALRGSALAVRRLMKCQPFGSCGHDPVPERRG